MISFSRSESPICYGIIHGTRLDNTGGKLAIVVHSGYTLQFNIFTHYFTEASIKMKNRMRYGG